MRVLGASIVASQSAKSKYLNKHTIIKSKSYNVIIIQIIRCIFNTAKLSSSTIIFCLLFLEYRQKMIKFKLLIKILFSLIGLVLSGFGAIVLMTIVNMPLYFADPEVYILISFIFLLAILALFIAHLI